MYNVEISSVLATIGSQNNVCRIWHDINISWLVNTFITTQQVLDCSCSNRSSGPKSIDSNSLLLELLSHAQNTHWHTVFCHCVCNMIGKPFRLHVKRRRNVQDMRIFGLEKMRQAVFGDHKGTSNVNLMHEVVFLHGLIDGVDEVDGWSVVNKNINSSKSIDDFLNTFLNTFFTSDVTLKRKGFSTFLLDLFSCCVDGAYLKTEIPGRVGWGLTVLARMATLAPSSAHLRPIASPIPLEAPVITIVFPLRGFEPLLDICWDKRLILFMYLWRNNR